MEYNVYAPPAAALEDVEERIGQTPYYVVSRSKFFALFLVTLGSYALVWSYLHWRNYKRTQRDPVSPVWRSVFMVFFFHSLTEEIGQSLRRDGIRHAWSPWWLASGCVGLYVVNIVVGVSAQFGVGSFLGVLGWTVVYLACASAVFWRIQLAANIASGDATGEGNRRYTLWNWLWTLFYAVRWAGLVMVAYIALAR